MNLLNSLESDLDRLAEQADYYYLLNRICVGKSNQIAARTLSLVSSEENRQLLSYSRPQDGKEFGLYTDFDLENRNVTISGNGTMSGQKETADYTISVDGIPFLRLRTSDFDTEQAKEGYTNGTFTLSPLSGISSLSGADEIAGILSNYALKISCSSSEKSGQAEISLLSGELPLFTLSSEYQYGSSGATDFPKKSDAVYNLENTGEIIQYVSSINWDQVVNILHKADIPEEYVTILEDSIQQLRSYLSIFNK